MTKEEILTKAEEIGYADASALREEAHDGTATQTDIIDRENSVPAWKKKDYTNWPINSPVADGGQVWLLLQPHDARNYDGHPADLRALWGLAHTTNPEKAKPYVAPYGTSGLYMLGECCVFDGAVYRSAINNNAYSPADYPAGWEEIA